MKVANINIPNNVYKHRFYKELDKILSSYDMGAKTSMDRVFGTHNTHKPELYGFVGHIEPHRDNKGIVYFMPLNDVKGIFYNSDGESIDYKQGDVIRMDDRVMHGVYQKGHVVAMFIGAFDFHQDHKVIELFNRAITQLSDGNSYKTAPRWLSAPIARDECFELEDLEPVRNLLQHANEPILCSVDECNKVAVKLDNKFPYFWEYNLCHIHNN